MAGICSAHQGYSEDCRLCNVTFGDFPTNHNEVIKAAAIIYSGRIYSLPSPNRHNNVLLRIESENPGCIGPFIQGFVTCEGIFVDRIEGAKIALGSGQIEKLRWPPNLYSEDLW